VIEASLRKTFPRATVNAEVEGKRGRAVLKGNFRRVRLELANVGNIQGLPFVPAHKAEKVGHLGRLELALRDFQFNGLPVEKAEFAFDKVEYDTKALKETSKLMLLRSGPATARMTIGAPALETLMARNLKGITDVKMSLRDGRVVMNGKKQLPLVEIGVPFTFTARPEPRGNEIWLTDARVAMENVTGFTFPVKNLLGDLNPIYAFDPEGKWPFRVRITNVTAQNDSMEIATDFAFTGGGNTAGS
jgi:hypothetical protein